MRRPFIMAVVALVCGIGAGAVQAEPLSPLPSPSGVASSPTFSTFAVYSHQPGQKMHYSPSGYMGDSDVSLSNASLKTAQGEDAALKLSYRASGPKGWTGIYWQDPANNWGERPGKAGYDLRGAVRLRFRARGENGGERVQKFVVGGITGKYSDSDLATLANVKLSKEWQTYEIDLRGKDLRHIIGGFGVFLNKSENHGGAVIYLDDVVFESASAKDAVVYDSGAPAIGKPVVPPPPMPAMMTPPAVPSQDLDVKQVDAGLKVSFSSQLMFASGKSVLEATGDKVLDQLVSLLAAYPSNNVLVEGHTDSTGSKGFNLKLSELRAQAVRDYLIKKGGYDKARFQVTGYGDTKPVGDNKTRAGRSLNRRVEVTILKTGPTDAK